MSDMTGLEWLQNASEKVFRTTGNAALRDLQNDPEGKQLSQLVQNAHQLTDSVVREVVEFGPVTQRPACCEGCTACCYLHVVATPMEVIAASTAIHERLSPSHIEEVEVRIERHIEQSAGIDGPTRRTMRLPCPLLDNGRCMIYAVRPISCRGWNSLDRSVCDADLAAPALGTKTPANLGQYVLAGRVAEGLAAAGHSLGLESQQVDFVRGLQIALKDPSGTAAAWRAGDEVFNNAENNRVYPDPATAEQKTNRMNLWNSL